MNVLLTYCFRCIVDIHLLTYLPTYLLFTVAFMFAVRRTVTSDYIALVTYEPGFVVLLCIYSAFSFVCVFVLCEHFHRSGFYRFSSWIGCSVTFKMSVNIPLVFYHF